MAVVGALLGGGLLSGVAVLVRAPKQGQLDVLSASKIIYDELRSELDDARDSLDVMTGRYDECEHERARLRGELTQSEAECEYLRERITYVEDQIRRRQQEALAAGDVMLRPKPDVSSD